MTLCDPIDCSLPGSSVMEILQAKILEWVAMLSSRGIFPAQGLNPGLLCCRQILHHMSHQGSPKYMIKYAMLCYAKSLQSCPTLCDPIDGSLPGSPVPGVLQARTLEQVAISFSNAWKWNVKVKLLSCVQLPATPWTAANQAPPSMGFSRQEYWKKKNLKFCNYRLPLCGLYFHFHNDISWKAEVFKFDEIQFTFFLWLVFFAVSYFFMSKKFLPPWRA